MTLPMPGPKNAAKAMASKIPGNDKKRVDQQKIYEAIKPSAQKTGEETDGEAGRATSQDNGDCDKERDARAVNSSRKCVTAEFIRAHPVGAGRGFQARGKMLSGRVRRGDPGREQRCENKNERSGKSRSSYKTLPKKLAKRGKGDHESRTRGSMTA